MSEQESLEVFGLKFQPMTPQEEKDMIEREQQAEIKRKREKLLEHYRSDKSGVPERYKDESLDTYMPWCPDADNALKKVCEFTKAKGAKTLILCGPPGVGKSHLGCGAIRECGGIYRTILRLLYEVDGTMSFKAHETKIQLLDRYCYTPLLVLDEIGRTNVRNDAQLELVSYIIGERYANNRKSLLITPYTKEVFCKWIGLSLFDRLCEVGETVSFSCDSYRPIKKEVEKGKNE